MNFDLLIVLWPFSFGINFVLQSSLPKAKDRRSRTKVFHSFWGNLCGNPTAAFYKSVTSRHLEHFAHTSGVHQNRYAATGWVESEKYDLVVASWTREKCEFIFSDAKSLRLPANQARANRRRTVFYRASITVFPKNFRSDFDHRSSHWILTTTSRSVLTDHVSSLKRDVCNFKNIEWRQCEFAKICTSFRSRKVLKKVLQKNLRSL